MSLNSIFRGPATGHGGFTDLGILIVRAFAGLALSFGHGLGKLPVSPGFVDSVGNLGFPVPIVFAWAAALSEFLGGIFLAAGFYTRISSIMVMLTMATAAFIRHAADPFGSKEKALLFLVISILLLLSGPGRFSLDRVLK